MPNGRVRRAGRAGLGLVAVGLSACAAFLVGTELLGDSATTVSAVEPHPGGTPAASPSAPRSASFAHASPRPRRLVRPTREPGAGVPVRVVIDALEVDAPVVPIYLEASTLVPPPDPQALGWWAEGAVPGAARGSALITGHTVHTGGGAMDDLETLAPGDELAVWTARGRVDYRVDRVEVYDKERVRRAAPHIFSQDVRGRVLLITCEDWDGTGYNSNVVVVAHPR